MKRLRRILWNTATGLSLAAFVAMGVLWVRSYWLMDFAGFTWRDATLPGDANYGAVSCDGQVYASKMRVYDQPGQEQANPAGWRFGSVDLKVHPGSPVIEPSFRQKWFGFAKGHGRINIRFSSSGNVLLADDAWFSMQWAYPCAIAALLPGTRMAIWYRRRRRHPVGSCRRCGYDLRATPDRCPECGTAAITSEL